MNIADLPPWAQVQAVNQIAARQRKSSGWSRAPSPALLDEEEAPRRKTTKYHSRKAARISPEGNTLEFDSQKEARRYDELALLLTAGTIRELKLQPEFTLQEAYTTTEGVRVRAIRYQADFSYERATAPDCNGDIHWVRVVEDVKSEATRTRVYEIKKKLLRERYGIDIREV